MLRHIFASFVLSLLLLAAGGCQSVTTTAIVGTPSQEVAMDIQGTWQFQDTAFYTKAIGNGQLVLASVNWKKDQWNLNQRAVTTTKIGKQNLLFVSGTPLNDDGDSDQPAKDAAAAQYQFYKLIYDGSHPRQIVAYLPDAAHFASAIDAGKLKGSIEKDSKGNITKVALSSTAKEIEAYLSGDGRANAFMLESPLVLVRLGK